jgi:hypothetical protein
MAAYSMAGLLSCACERVFVMWSGSYHLTKGTSRFILSTGSVERRRCPLIYSLSTILLPQTSNHFKLMAIHPAGESDQQ